MSILLLIIIVATATYASCSASQPGGRGTHLSTFRTENLKIRAPGKRFPSIIDEAIWLMRTHFLKRQILSKRDWDKLPSEFTGYDDVNKAMEDLMRRFHDPYSRHIPETVMMLRQRGIRGETVGIGVMLKRSWHFNELPRAIRGLFMAPANNFTCGGRSSTQLPYQSSEKGSRGNVFSNLFNRLKGENTKLNSLAHTIGRRKMWTCYSFFQHLTVTFQTAAPFFLAAACHHFSDLDILKKAPGNTRVVKVISISIGVMQIIKKLTSIICPIEVASLQSGGPSVSSGVEIGDQVYFVDGRAVNTLSLKKVNELLSEGEVGDTVHVGIVRARRNLQAPSTSSSPATSNTVNGDYSSRGTISHTNSNSNEYSTHNSQENVQDRASKVSDLPGSEGKEFISFEIIRDNVFASRVSSCILSYPSYSDPRSAAKTVAKEFDLEEDLVASAGILNRSHSESETGGIGYISIGEFTQRTLLEVENALDTIKKQLYLAAQKRKRQRPTTFTRNKTGENRVSSALSEEESEGASSYLLDGLIIDLRGNLGGTLPSALDAASLFLPQGNVLLQMKTMASPAALSANDIVRNGNGNSGSGSQVSRRGTASFLKGVPFLGVLTKSLRKTNDRIERYYSTSKDSDVSTPLLLLVDSHTASASEIFAAALIDNNRATCMGSKTLGKNVAQAIMMLSDGSGLVFTIREFLSPLGRYMGNGITPHILVSEPRKLHLAKIKYNPVSKKWNLAEKTFADNCSNIFQ